MKHLIITVTAILAMLLAVSCKIEVPGTTPNQVAAPVVAPVVVPAAAPVVVVAAKPVVKAAVSKAVKPVHAKGRTTSAAERAAYAKAYANAAHANQLLGRHAFSTGPNDHVGNNLKRKTKMSGDHKVQQDANYVSKVPAYVVAAFLAGGKPPVANRVNYDATQKRHPSTEAGKSITIGQDMPLAPAVYGFDNKVAVDQWFEKAFDTPV